MVWPKVLPALTSPSIYGVCGVCRGTAILRTTDNIRLRVVEFHTPLGRVCPGSMSVPLEVIGEASRG